MDFTTYQDLARRTQNPSLTMHQTLEHALYGLAAEVGEVLSIYQKGLQGHPVNPQKIDEELGDILWMMAELADCNHSRLENIAAKNIAKLQARYPQGFNAEQSIHREV